ncbi:hypothetical protein [Acaryochloris thomasi]|nr:hypothetical protein [Acaryochloris thomasi]
MSLSFLGASALLKTALSKFAPEPIVRTYTVKMAEFEKAPNQYKILFVGSSHIHYHLMPDQFDSHARSQGFSFQSFNMGSPNLDRMETNALVKRIISSGPENLKYIFIEPRSFSSNFKNPDSLRAVYFHNHENTAFLLDYIVRSSLEFDEKFLRIKSAIQSFSINFFNIGDLHKGLTQGATNKLDVYSLGPQKNGFAEMKWYCRRVEGKEGKACLRKIQKFSKKLDEENDFYRSAQTEYNKSLRGTEPFSKYQIQSLVDLSNTLKEQGITAIFLNTPAVYGGNDQSIAFKLAYKRDTPPIHILDYNDPSQFPSLFQEDLWYDNTHLNQQGAQLLTQYIASDFLKKFSASLEE